MHLSPGNGEDDFWAAHRRGVPIFAPFDDEVKFTKDAGIFTGVFARDADMLVVEELRNRNAFVKIKKSNMSIQPAGEATTNSFGLHAKNTSCARQN